MSVRYSLLVPVLASAQPYLIETVAGGARFEFPAGTVPAAEIRFIQPEGIAGGPQGEVYIADSYYDRIVRVAPDGSAVTYAGTVTGFGGDGGPASAARFNFVGPITVGPSGDLFVGDLRNGRIRRIAAATGTITTYATGAGNPRAIAFDSAGTLYFADSANHIVGKVEPAGTVTVIAGRRGTPGFGGDGGPATAATLNGPRGLAFDSSGNIIFTDASNHRIRRINPQGVIETLSGTGVPGSAPNNVPVATAVWNGPGSVVIDRAGDIYVGDGANGRIRRIRGGMVTVISGGGTSRTFPGRASLTRLETPFQLALGPNQQLLVNDSLERRSYRIDLATDTIQAVAGLATASGGGDGGPAVAASFLTPAGVAAARDGSIYVTDPQDHRVRRIDPNGIITTFAGSGRPEITGDGGQARNAGLGLPRSLAFDPAGNLYIGCNYGAVVRRVTPQGVISTLTGGPTTGFSGDGGPASAARIQGPNALAADNEGNIFFTDSANHRVRRVSTNGVITTVAGSSQSGFAGDGGPATEARLLSPQGVAVDLSGNIFVSDSQNNRIRRVDRQGVITTFATVPGPGPLAFDSEGNLLVTQPGQGQIRAIRPDGSQQVIAGSNTTGFSGDGGPATEARLAGAAGIALGANGEIYFADQLNERVRKLTPIRLAASGIVNLASGIAGPLAPNQLARISGIRLGPAEAVVADPGEAGAYPKSLGGVEVLVDGVPVPLILARESVVVAIMPATLAGSARVEVRYEGRLTNPVSIATSGASPGIFTENAATGKGAATARNADGAISAENPARVGSEVTIRVTGAGAVDPLLEDGMLAPDDSSKPVLPIEVSVGGIPAELVAASVPTGLPAGIVEIRFRVPEGEPGELPLVVKAGDASSQPDVTLTVAPPAQ